MPNGSWSFIPDRCRLLDAVHIKLHIGTTGRVHAYLLRRAGQGPDTYFIQACNIPIKVCSSLPVIPRAQHDEPLLRLLNG